MKRIRVSALAEHDLDEIWYFIAKNAGSIEIANSVIESITGAFSLLANAPEAGRKRDEIEAGVRGFTVGNYIVYYRNAGPRLTVSRIIHGMRDQKSAYRDHEP